MRSQDEVLQAIAKAVAHRDEIRLQLRERKRDFQPLSVSLNDVNKARQQIDKYMLTVLEIKDLEVEQSLTLGSLAAYYDVLGYDSNEILELQSDAYWMGSTDERKSTL